MKVRTAWLGLLLVVPTLLAGQQPAGEQPPFEVMQANVARIRNTAEKDRWMANVDLWKIALAQPGPVAAEDRSRMDALLQRIRYNVARIRNAPEKQRWETNIALWRVLIEGNGVLSKADVATLTPQLETMKANVADISVAAEHERWQANRELWEVVLARNVAAH